MSRKKILKYIFLLITAFFLSAGKIRAQKFIDNFEITHFKLPIETTSHAILQDSFGFLWIGTTNGLWRYDGGNFKNYIKNENDKTSITDNNISYLYEDKKNTLWVGTYGGGLLKYDRNCDCFQQFIHDEENSKSISFNEIKTIFETVNNQFYIGTDGGGLNLMNRSTNTFKSFKFKANDTTSISHNNVLDIKEISNGNLAIGTWIGLNIFNPKTENFERSYREPKAAPQHHHRLEYYNGKLITASNKFFIHNSKEKFVPLDISTTHAYAVKKQNNENCWFLTDNAVYIANAKLKIKQKINLNTLFKSEKGFLPTRLHHNKSENSTWLLDRFGSFFLIEKKSTPFKPFIKDNFRGRISQTSKNYWISRGNQINIFNKKTNKLEELKTKFTGRAFIATKGNNNVWVVDDEYYYEFSTSGKLIKKLKQDTWPFAIIQTSNDQLWIGEVLGASNFNVTTNKNIKYECDWNTPKGIGYFHKIVAIFEDSKGQVWLGTEGDGLKQYLAETDEFVHYRHKIGDKTTLNNNFVKEIFEDRQNNLWIGTSAGLCRLSQISNTFIQSENSIIKDKIVQSIEQDSNNNLWIGTLNGLIKYDYINNKIRILNEQDGLLSHKIGSSSLHLDNDNIVFGTNKGFMVFNPAEVTESQEPSKLYISKLSVNNNIVKSNSKYITRNIEVENQVNLGYDDKKFEFEFQAINYNNNRRCKFAYKLDGYDKTWIEVKSSQKATYTNIPSGNYTFMVKGSNEHGFWGNNIKSINLSIKPPFWELIWVKAISLLLMILIFILILWLVIKKERDRSKFEIEKERVLQFEEVAKMKLKFFTNISHELRTPLTLITSPLDKFVQEKTKPNNKVLEMMHRNSSRLLELVNQILDFRKLESNPKLQISPQKDFSVFNNINASSTYWSTEKNISYNFKFPRIQYELFFDSDILEKIVTNLISNAFKYTSENGKVELIVNFNNIKLNQNNKTSKGFMEVHVIDNGSGIPIEYQEKVFERFYQLDENLDFGYSSGIGLSLTSELVKLHKGHIELKTSKEKGCHFKVEIPIGFDDYQTNSSLEDLKLSVINNEETLVLIVEDNDDIRNYIHDELKENYQVAEAQNGKEGLKLAISTLPDVIISDIMMAESDGIQFANQLKSNDLTAHIPLLFLTAKIGTENKIAGLKAGAEDYIQKPFNILEIKLKIKNVLESRNKLLKKFKAENLIKLQKSKTANRDKYLEKVNSILENHLENSEFSIDKLCSELSIGRSQLYRKIQALTGKSIIEYTNSYRLSIAMQLIKEGKHTLKEISYKIGYNDNRYFSRTFKKEYGNPPSHYVSKKNTTE